MFRKMILTTAVAMLVLPAMASAQAQVTATATVGQAFALGGTDDLAFGTLSATVNNVIDATSGAVIRTLDYNYDVAVTFANVPSALSSAGLTDLPVTLSCAAESGGAWTAAADCLSASFDLDVGPALTQATLGFGGTITAAAVAAAAAGDYTATFDIVVTAR
jgi:hypothetical protein